MTRFQKGDAAALSTAIQILDLYSDTQNQADQYLHELAKNCNLSHIPINVAPMKIIKTLYRIVNPLPKLDPYYLTEFDVPMPSEKVITTGAENIKRRRKS